MAKQNITLDEILAAMKGAKTKLVSTQLSGSGSGTITLSQPITDFDFITIEAGDNTDDNPDNSLSCRVTKSITFKRRYTDIGTETQGSGNIESASAHIEFMFMDAKTFKVVNQHNHSLIRILGWKSVIEWGANIL